MAKKRKPAVVKLSRLEARIRVLQAMTRMAFLMCCISAGFVVVATAFPQQRKLEAMQQRLAEAKAREQVVLAEREYHTVEHKALREDPAYLEMHARDRLDLYREGERVLKFNRER